MNSSMINPKTKTKYKRNINYFKQLKTILANVLLCFIILQQLFLILSPILSELTKNYHTLLN